MPGTPALDQWYRQEHAPGIAEDRAEHVAVGETVTVPAGTFTDTVRAREWSPLESGTSTKIYGRGIGMLVDNAVERQP